MRGRRILIVDDDEEILSLLEKKLSSDGFEVVVARDGKEALELARTHTPQLILMDIVMPGVDGPEVVALLKDDPTTQFIPIVFLSGIVAEEGEGGKFEVKVAGRRFDAIPKPFEYKTLLEKVKEYLK
jgi:CheY-like chemotaxis protein